VSDRANSPILDEFLAGERAAPHRLDRSPLLGLRLEHLEHASRADAGPRAEDALELVRRRLV
jgi:hypothetical protein